VPGLGHLLDLVGQVLADARNFREVGTFGQHGRHAARQASHGARRVPIGAHAKGVGAFDFQQFGGAVQDLGDLGIEDGHGRHSVLLYPAHAG
jgi:hypothetical protein